MRLNHINLVVQDIVATISLFQDHFGFHCKEVKGNNMIAVLQGIDDFTLVLMSTAMVKTGGTDYPETFHIGFMLDSKEDVSALWQKLKASGIGLGREPSKIRDTFGFYFQFDAIMIEVGYYISEN